MTLLHLFLYNVYSALIWFTRVILSPSRDTAWITKHLICMKIPRLCVGELFGRRRTPGSRRRAGDRPNTNIKYGVSNTSRLHGYHIWYSGVGMTLYGKVVRTSIYGESVWTSKTSASFLTPSPAQRPPPNNSTTHDTINISQSILFV